jgi:exodeoxyribonuclease V alpha subunit
MTALEGTVQRVVFQSGAFCIFEFLLEEEANDRLLWTARGHLFGLLRLTYGVPLRLHGNWGRHPKYGQQFKVKSWDPWYKDEGSFRAFLTYCIRGTDALSVEAICERYGSGVLEALKTPARILEEVAGNRQDLQSTVLGWEQAIATCGLSHFLRGMSTSDIETAVHRLGPDAASLLRANPYRLLQIPGFSFAKADDFAESLGLPKSSPERVSGAILWALDRATRAGHLFLRPDQLATAALDIPSDVPIKGDFAAALGALVAEKLVRLEGAHRVYLPEYFEYERRSAKHLAALRAPSRLEVDLEAFLAEFQAASQLALSDAQKAVVGALTKSRILVINGLPGTGKSTSVRALVQLFERARVSFVLMAPTGIASKRLSLITGCPASTIHRALGFDGSVWAYGPRNRYVVDAVIVDEVSMVDQELIYRLLVSLREDTILVLVGDAAQLPSVGPGNVLKELVACPDLPRVELTEIFRQSAQGDIVGSSHQINRGEFPELGDPKSDSEFRFVPLQDDYQVRDYIVRMAEKLKARDANFQVLTAKYGGVVGVDALNQALREVLNPPGPAEWKGETQHFRVGDRIMVVKNDYKKNVWNGDVGKLLYIEGDRLILRIYGLGEDLQVSFSEADAEEKLRLAYAVTVHRCQGNEFDTILMPVALEQGRMLQRNLLYTAVTRAKKQVWLLGQKAALQRAIDNNKVTLRNTVLGRAITGVLRSQPKGEPCGPTEDRDNL